MAGAFYRSIFDPRAEPLPSCSLAIHPKSFNWKRAHHRALKRWLAACFGILYPPVRPSMTDYMPGSIIVNRGQPFFLVENFWTKNTKL
ncbi:hypothetical protein EPK99_05185 [Neorhizobium lilium]|uniref:Uncharacterized protein n=1 Tax=Neorhizobium lilium TaxID=2503024 RepID=A0A3S3SJ05_9HYPH|nr:hypothetical protein [Neorhizobium lilium]RWX81654.1 hypothetical protein EPK99_05185 [Neorhizobium lilium]